VAFITPATTQSYARHWVQAAQYATDHVNADGLLVEGHSWKFISMESQSSETVAILDALELLRHVRPEFVVVGGYTPGGQSISRSIQYILKGYDTDRSHLPINQLKGSVPFYPLLYTL